jgi:hypothetical protein
MVKIIFTVNGEPKLHWKRTTITKAELKDYISGATGGLLESLEPVFSSEDGTYHLEDGHTYEVPVVLGLYFYHYLFVSNLLF